MPLPNTFNNPVSSNPAVVGHYNSHYREIKSSSNAIGSSLGSARHISGSSTSSNSAHPQQQQQQQQQQDHLNNFCEVYEHLCAMQNLNPLQLVRSSISTSDNGYSLALNADRLKSLDWDPVFGALKLTRNLKTINIHSKYSLPVDEQTERGSRGYMSSRGKKVPSIRLKERTNKLCRSVRDCLSVSMCLSTLEIYNIALMVKECAQIAKGLRGNKTLKTLSLDSCLIGDEGLAVICKDIQNSVSLNRINFSACLLSYEGANILATLIKVQALKRHNEAWKDSLRYARDDLESMFGIRRITINCNPLVGDRGVQALADAFKSDLWLKALDLQDCGITTQGANYLLDGLKFNAMMHVLDVRLNANIDRETLQKIMEQVMINSTGNSTEYEWMELIQSPVNVQHQQQQQSYAVMLASGVVETAATAANNMSNSMIPPAATTTSTSTSGRRATQQQQQPVSENKQAQISTSAKKRRTTNASFSIKPRVSSSGSQVSNIKRSKSTGSVTLNMSGASAGGGGSSRPPGPSHRGGGSGNYHGHHHRHHPNSVKRHHTCHNAASASSTALNAEQRWRSSAARLIARSRHNRIASPVDADFIDEDDQFEFDGNEEDEVIEEGENTNRVETSENNAGVGEEQESMVSSTFDYGRFGNKRGTDIETTTKTSLRHQQQQQRKVLSNSNNNECVIDSKGELVSNLDKMKHSSVKDLLVILQKEIDSKTQLEEMLLQLQDQNTNLKLEMSSVKSENQSLKAKVEEQEELIERLSSEPSNRTMTLEDAKALEIIELSLLKYQNFLDFLRNTGFGKLIELGELNQQRLVQQQQEGRKCQSQSTKAQTSQKRSLDPDESAANSTLRKEFDYEEIAYLAAKMMLKNHREDETNHDDESSCISYSDEIANLLNDLKFGANRSMTTMMMSTHHETSIDSNFDADENTLDVDTLISNALEISRSYRRMNSSSVNNSTLSLLTNLEVGQMTNRGGKKLMVVNEKKALDETNKENSMADQSTILNND